MFILGLILLLVGFFVVHSTIMWVIGLVLAVVGLGGNGYAHFGPGPNRRYFY